MKTLKNLFIESLYYHQEEEADLAIKCVIEWLDERRAQAQAKYGNDAVTEAYYNGAFFGIDSLYSELLIQSSKEQKEIEK